MAPVEKYIRKLLFEFDCVIIPDFGGLLTHHVGVRYDESAQLFQPAGKRLAFNEILRIDDGLLAYYFAAGEQISREQATAEIRRFVASLRADLDNKQIIAIEKVGSFSANYEGRLIFEPDYQHNYDQNWYGLEEIRAERSEWQPNWLRQDAESAQEAEMFVAEQDSDSVIPLPNRRSARWGWAAAVLVVCAASAASFLYAPDDRNLLSSLDPIALVSSLYQATGAASDQPSTGVGPTNVGVAYFREVKPETAAAPEPQESVSEEDPAMVATGAVESQQPEVALLDESYFLIAGSFGSQRNARRFKAQLLRQGFDKAEVLDGKSGKWIMVSAGSYETMFEALSDKSKLDELSKSESWVFHRR